MNEPIYPFLDGFLPGLAYPVVIELGAHNGTDTEWMLARLRRPYTYIAVEPDERNVARLLTLAYGESLRVIAAAVGNKNGVTTFYRSGGNPGGSRSKGWNEHTDSGSLKKPVGFRHRYPWMQFTESRVLVYELDVIAKNERLGDVDLIWADIQGAELEMIEGGKLTLARTRFLYTECYANPVLYEGQPTFEQIVAALPGRWRVVFRTHTDVLLENENFSS